MLVTDRHGTLGRPLPLLVKAALAGGVEAVQVREKELDTCQLLELAQELKVICQAAGATILINDRVDVALAVEADGVQLTRNSYSARQARRLLGRQKLIGVSTHSLDEAREAEKEGADYLLFGPVFDTPSKRAYGEPQGTQRLAQVANAMAIPVFAIGGIKEANLGQVMEAGAWGIALISGILQQKEVEGASRRLRERISLYLSR